MSKFHFLEKLEVILNSFVISLVASFVRLIFYRTGGLLKTCLVFFGGIIFGTLVGYLIDGTGLASYDKILVATAAIVGKEIVEFLITGVPKLLKKFLTKKIGVSDDDNTDS